MFETSVVQAGALDVRRSSRFSLLTLSLLAHSAVIVGVMTVSLATVEFPSMAPDEFAQAPIFHSIQIPPPLGRPDGGKPAVTPPKQEQKQAAPPPPTQLTAPTLVPETITPAESTGPASSEADGPGDGTQPGPKGVEWGVENSPGDPDGPPLTIAPTPVENKIYSVGEVQPPVIIRRVDPQYPQVLIRARVPGTVAVRCVIDKNGRIRDAQVIHATMPPFGESVLRALKDWRYQPASLKGQAVECYLDLTVSFGVK